MDQDYVIRLQLGAASSQPESDSRSLASLALPLLASLLQTYGFVWMICRTPWYASLSWPRLFFTALSFLFVTAVAHAFAVWSNRRLFPRQSHASATILFFAIWPCIVWLPLFVLLIRESSPFVVVAAPLISTSAIHALKRWTSPGRSARSVPLDPEVISTLFHTRRPSSLFRTIAPALAGSVALQAAIGALALRHAVLAGALLAVGTTPLVWRTLKSPGPPPHRDIRSSLSQASPRTLTVLLLLCLALLPYLGSSQLAIKLGSLLRASRLNTSAPPPDKQRDIGRSDLYTGVILIPPRKPRQTVVPAPVAPVRFSSLPARAITIPFDGAYWYFRQPDQRPRPSAPVVRGDPTKRSIRSLDMRPISMQARQRLDTPIQMDCCHVIRLSVQSAESSPGAISIEVLLGDRGTRNSVPISLGSQILPSSESSRKALPRAPVTETLSFSFPRPARHLRFDEIIVAIKPSGDRARAGAHIAVQSFELSP